MHNEEPEPISRTVRCIVLTGVIFGITITEVKHSVIHLRDGVKKLGHKFKKRIRSATDGN